MIMTTLTKRKIINKSGSRLSSAQKTVCRLGTRDNFYQVNIRLFRVSFIITRTKFGKLYDCIVKCDNLVKYFRNIMSKLFFFDFQHTTCTKRQEKYFRLW